MTGAGRLLDLLENLPDHMLEEALESQKKRKRGRIRRAFYVVAAAACIMVLFMTFVPAGQAMAAQIREGMVSLLEKWFPPKEIPVYPEGEEENITHEIYGDLSGSLPEQGESGLQEAESIMTAGFAIYVDRENFETLEDGEDYLIREKPFVYTREAAMDSISALLEGLSEEAAEQKIQERMKEAQAFYDSLPVCEIRITQIPQTTPEDAAAKMREELLGQYGNMSEITDSDLLNGLYLFGYEDAQWDSGVVEVYFVDNGLGGVFVIKARYYMEATEGTGTRFHSMIKTFKVLSPEDSDMQAQFEEETPDTQTGD